MAGPTVLAAFIEVCGYPRALRLHGKTDINVTKPAGKHGSVKPMIEDNARNADPPGVVVKDHPAVRIATGDLKGK